MVNFGKLAPAARKAVVPLAGAAAIGVGVAAATGALSGTPAGDIAEAISGVAGSAAGVATGLLDNWGLVVGVGGAAVVLFLLLR